RRRRHAELTDHLLRWPGASPAQRAEHALRAERHAECLEHAEAAARQAAAGLAFARAIKWLRLALALPAGVVSEQRAASLRALLASTLAAAGQGVRAAEQFLQLAELAAPRGSAASVGYRLRAAEQLL